MLTFVVFWMYILASALFIEAIIHIPFVNKLLNWFLTKLERREI